MDMEIIDTVTADTLEVGDVICLEGVFCTVLFVNDVTEVLDVEIREYGYDDSEMVEMNPNLRLNIYGHFAVEV